MRCPALNCLTGKLHIIVPSLLPQRVGLSTQPGYCDVIVTSEVPECFKEAITTPSRVIDNFAQPYTRMRPSTATAPASSSCLDSCEGSVNSACFRCNTQQQVVLGMSIRMMSNTSSSQPEYSPP
eukprot:4944002-Amphidinium_carterae.1